jgi:hypothetical protein
MLGTNALPYSEQLALFILRELISYLGFTTTQTAQNMRMPAAYQIKK